MEQDISIKVEEDELLSNELLFFDTFAHDNDQFPNPVIISEIRIIPLGAKVEADFPGGVRLGATNPSSFSLDIYMNDLGRPFLSTFSDVGRFNYKQNVNIQFILKERRPTDGLLIKGCFRTITLAIFGVTTDVKEILQTEESLSAFESSDVKPSAPVESTPPQTIFSESSRSRDQVKAEDLQPLLSKLASALASQKNVSKPFPLGGSPKILLVNDRTDERPTSSKDRKIIDQSRSDSEKVPMFSRRRRLLSPVRSPASTHSDVSFRSEKTANRSLIRTDIPTSPCSSQSSRSPTRFVHSGPHSPFYAKNQTELSHFPPSFKASASPSPSTPSLISKSSHQDPHKWKRRKISPTSPLLASPLQVTSENRFFDDEGSNCLSGLISPVNRDLLEEISPEQSASDWENISEDENLEDISSLDGNDGVVPNSNDQEAENLESISSDDDFDEGVPEVSDDFSCYSGEIEEYNPFWKFDSENIQLNALETLEDPSRTAYEIQQTKPCPAYNEKRLHLESLLSEKESRNQKWVESIETLAKDCEFLPLSEENLFKTVFDWLIDALNSELSIRQNVIPLKVRQIKAGIKLASALFATDDQVRQVMFNLEIPKTLLTLYREKNTSLPIKLLILRSIDALCDSVSGIEHLLNKKYQFDNTIDSVESTCYQKLLRILLGKPSSRIAVAIEALLNKIHLYLLVKKLRELIDSKISESNLSVISPLLRRLGTSFSSMQTSCTQKTRYLPVSRSFELKKADNNCFQSFYTWAKHYQLIDGILTILEDRISTRTRIFEDIEFLLQKFFIEESFPRFLLSSGIHQSTNRLMSFLLNIRNCKSNGVETHEIISYFCGILQVYQLIDSLKSIVSSPSFDVVDVCDDLSTCSILNKLFSLSTIHTGRKSLAKVLSTSRNFDNLLPFLKSTGRKEDDVVLFESTCSSYSAELCALVVEMCADDALEFFKSYGKSLWSLSESVQSTKLSCLSKWLLSPHELTFDYSEKTFKELLTIIKNHVDSIAKLKENEIFEPSPVLITVMRILQNLSSPCRNSFLTFDPRSVGEIATESTELKYHYALIQIFSLDGLSSLLILLEKYADTLLRPSHLSAALSGSSGTFVISLIAPCINLVKRLLISLIASRGKDFQDISPIPVMLKVFSVMYLFPSSSPSFGASQRVIREIVQILTLYTDLSLTSSETDPEVLNKSIWSKMVKEVLDYTVSLPMTFIHGLSLLSELLPLPLPFQSLTTLTSEEVNKLVSIRKIWSAHLLGLASDLEKLITSFVLCSSPIIQQLLRRVCVQISDLSSPAATLVVRSVLEALLDALSACSADRTACSLVYTLNLLAFLITHPPFKMAFIHTMHIKGRLDEKYFSIVNKLLQRIMPCATKHTDIQANTLIFNFLLALCDANIYLCPESTPMPPPQILSNALPPLESIKIIVSALLRFISNICTDDSSSLSVQLKNSSPGLPSSPQNNGDTQQCKPVSLLMHTDSQNQFFILSVFRILSLFCEHDYGFVPLKQAFFEDSSSAIHSFLKISSEMLTKCSDSKIDGYVQVIFSCIFFLKSFILESEKRSCKLTPQEVQTLLNWSCTNFQSTVEGKEEKPVENLEDGKLLGESKEHREKHPLILLREYFATESVTSCDELDSTMKTVESLLNLLNASHDEPEEGATMDNSPTIEPLSLQFSRRKVFILTESIDIEKLNPSYWLSVPAFHDHEHLMPLEKDDKINYIELCDKYFSDGFDITKSLQESLRIEEPDNGITVNRTEVQSKQIKAESNLQSRDSKSSIGVKRSFVAPLRGRGYNRTGNMIHSSRANDPFRSRPPNTSRPPSMHVDDFVALEQSGNNCSSYESNNKRFKLDYSSKQRNSNHNSSSRSFGSSSLLPIRASPSPSSYHPDRRSISMQHPHSHHSPSRNPPSNSSNRSSMSRYSRDGYSPTMMRSSRSGSIGPSTSAQHWAKSMDSRRDIRDSRHLRDSRLIRQNMNR
ncbi:VIR_N domain-containing protein isoform X2 [Brevipalpus obovatus]|uniref:VIR_N domain-containing protein isoform X2 n=1 Tax=Brevipalpus obovatus TaxID=246614 RepID=UPI003D9E5A25